MYLDVNLLAKVKANQKKILGEALNYKIKTQAEEMKKQTK